MSSKDRPKKARIESPEGDNAATSSSSTSGFVQEPEYCISELTRPPSPKYFDLSGGHEATGLLKTAVLNVPAERSVPAEQRSVPAELSVPADPGAPSEPRVIHGKHVYQESKEPKPLPHQGPPLPSEPALPSEPPLPHEPSPAPEPTPEAAKELLFILSSVILDNDDKEFEVEFGEEIFSFENSDSPLYAGASVTLCQSFIAILTLVLTFSLSGVCTKAILDLVSLHLPKKNIFKTSLKFFKNFFGKMLGGADIFEHYCSICFIRLDQKTTCEICSDSKVCYLVKLSLISQLQTLFNRAGFFSKLKFIQDAPANVFRDVYDGKVYQDLKKMGLVGKDGILTFLHYTDGAALFASSSMSVWPLYLCINELSYRERYKRENVLIPVIWCGPVKPPGNLLFNAAYPELSKLASGVTLNVKDIGEKEIKGIVINGTGDTPARSIVLNMVQFNGQSSCQRCEQPGIPRWNNPGVRLFPFKPDEMIPRTVEKMIQYGKIGTPKHPCVGVKGPTALAKLMPNFVSGTAVDPMHLVYGGVAKKILKLLTTTKQKDSGAWSISKHTAKINERLLSIKPPAHFERMPRSLEDSAYWKMKEFKAWFLDYSLPVLNGILPTSYLQHHATLVAAIQLLSANIVHSESITAAETLLQKYVSQFSDFYDLKYLTINFHLLLHLPEIVSATGPLWTVTCFALEAINGVILSLVHGTRWAEKQIATSVRTCLALPDLVNKMAPECPAKLFCKNVLNKKKFLTGVNVNGLLLIGSLEVVSTLSLSLSTMLISVPYSKLVRFYCLKKDQFLFKARSHTISMRRDSSVAVYSSGSNEEVGIIQEFLRVYSCDCVQSCECPSNVFAVIQELQLGKKFETLVEDIYVPNVNEYVVTNNLKLVNAQDFMSVAVRMDMGGRLYVSKPTNTVEME